MAEKIEFNKQQKKEIKKELQKIEKKKKDIKGYKGVQALRLHSIGKTNKKISEIIGFNAQYVTDLVRKYMKEGIDWIVNDRRTSNYRRLSFEEEREFLEQFVEKAEAGEILTADEIRKKFDEVTGKESHVNTIYCLLKRHGWRKVRPHPTNPKRASEEEIETEKNINTAWQQVLLNKYLANCNVNYEKIKGAKLMFQDEAGFGRITDPAACWAPPKKRPNVPCLKIREYKSVSLGFKNKCFDSLTVVVDKFNDVIASLSNDMLISLTL